MQYILDKLKHIAPQVQSYALEMKFEDPLAWQIDKNLWIVSIEKLKNIMNRKAKEYNAEIRHFDKMFSKTLE